MLVGIGGCILFRLRLDVFLNESGLLGIARRLGIVIRVSARLCLGEELLQFAVGVRGGNIFQDNKVLFFLFSLGFGGCRRGGLCLFDFVAVQRLAHLFQIQHAVCKVVVAIVLSCLHLFCEEVGHCVFVALLGGYFLCLRLLLGLGRRCVAAQHGLLCHREARAFLLGIRVLLEAFTAAALRGRKHVVGFFLHDARAPFCRSRHSGLLRLCVENVVNEAFFVSLVCRLQIKCVGDLQQFGRFFCQKLFFCEIFHTFVYAFSLLLSLVHAALFQFH